MDLGRFKDWMQKSRGTSNGLGTLQGLDAEESWDFVWTWDASGIGRRRFVGRAGFFVWNITATWDSTRRIRRLCDVGVKIDGCWFRYLPLRTACYLSDTATTFNRDGDLNLLNTKAVWDLTTAIEKAHDSYNRKTLGVFFANFFVLF